MPTGLTADAGWEIGASRTVDAPIELVWDHLISPEGLATWLGDGAELPAEVGGAITTTTGDVGELRSRHHHDRIRLRWTPAGRDGATVVQVALVPNGDRTRVGFHQDHLADAEERELQRTHWKAVLDHLESDLVPATDA